MRWTQQQYQAYEARRSKKGPKPERSVQDEPLGKGEGEEGNSVRLLVSVVSFRVRPCDPDNLCPKYFIDCLRYAEIIPDDSAEDIQLQVSQRKVATKKEERTEIVITR